METTIVMVHRPHEGRPETNRMRLEVALRDMFTRLINGAELAIGGRPGLVEYIEKDGEVIGNHRTTYDGLPSLLHDFLIHATKPWEAQCEPGTPEHRAYLYRILIADARLGLDETRFEAAMKMPEMQFFAIVAQKLTTGYYTLAHFDAA